MWACIYGHKDVVKLILDCPGTNIDQNARRTALMLAYRYVHTDVARLILDYSKERNIDEDDEPCINPSTGRFANKMKGKSKKKSTKN